MSKTKTLSEWYTVKAGSRTEWGNLWTEDLTLMDKMMYSVKQHLSTMQEAISSTFMGAIQSYIKATWEAHEAKDQLKQIAG